MTKKGFLQNNVSTLIAKSNIIKDENKIGKNLNNYNVKIDEKSSGINPNILGIGKLCSSDYEFLKE